MDVELQVPGVPNEAVVPEPRANVISRRGVIARLAAFVGGLAGTGMIAAGPAGASPAAPSVTAAPVARSPLRLSLVGRDLRGLAQRRGPHTYEPGDQIVSRATLLSAEGREVGSFHSSAVVVSSRAQQGGFATLEQHRFELPGGTLIGSGLVSRLGEPASFAVIGGTGRYQSSRGSYTAVQQPYHLGGDGTASFVLDLFDQE